MAYKVTVAAKVFKVLEKINEPTYSAIKDAINDLAENPRPFGYKKLKGRRLSNSDWRLSHYLYRFRCAPSSEVIAIGHRKNVYD